MKSITQSRQYNRTLTRLNGSCATCSGVNTSGDCQSIFIQVPIGTTLLEIPESDWNNCGVPTPNFLSSVTNESLNVTYGYDDVSNPTKITVDFGSPTSFEIYIHLTF